MHQVVAGSGGNTIDLALLSARIHEEHTKVSVPLKHSTKQSVEHYLRLMENPTTYTTHTEIVAADQIIIVQHPRATDIDWLINPIHYHQVQTHVCDVLYRNEHTIPRSVHSIP